MQNVPVEGWTRGNRKWKRDRARQRSQRLLQVHHSTRPCPCNYRIVDRYLNLYLVGDPTDPAVVWTKLSDQFQKKTWANKLALRRCLKLKEEQSVQEHIKQIMEIFDELSIVGDAIGNEDRVCKSARIVRDACNRIGSCSRDGYSCRAA